ncbi:gnat family [Moniliophthora roreri MCA 2997]|uniref:Gnat family n=2 Tax=Moniliophthora roreri TaxID=221103 RepID=V2XCW8_MONRO|nr:gnat family [Moniliophthora roreri MCA 2997]KAI3597494.1 gnat family [Moniliophthora roreri]
MYTPDPSYQLFSILSPASDAHIQRYKSLRLLVLRINPGSFVSQYNRERLLTDEQWRERLDIPHKVTIAAAKVDANGEWAGMLSLLSPESSNLSEYTSAEMLGSRSFVVVSVCIHPGHWGRGVGRLLIEGAISWVREWDGGGGGGGNGGGDGQRKLVLKVLKASVGALVFYTKLGFRAVEAINDENCVLMYLNV